MHVLPTSEESARAAAEFVSSLEEERTRTQGRFTIAFSGGSTPYRLYQLLASPSYREHIGWNRWHVFWSDERCVPPDHRDSNYCMAKEALLDHVPVPAGNIHRMRGEVTPGEAAEEYELELRAVFRPLEPIFDLILLGMGEDGHTASLFDRTDALQEEHRLVVANWVSHLQAHRITFTLPLINAASAIAFLVTDASRAGVLRRVLQPTPGDQVPPAAQVRPVLGTVHWFLTEGAASLLKEVSV